MPRQQLARIVKRGEQKGDDALVAAQLLAA
eukprot:COSAG01_NODE_34783_length_542_cov_0.808126_2_plen_29_part_01